MKKNNIFELVFCSVMSGFSVLLDTFISLDLGPFKITLYALPLVIIGIMYGPKLGTICGAVTGVCLQLFSKYGISLTSILWALAPIGWGGVSGVCFKNFKIKNTIVLTMVTITFASLSATCLNTLAMFGDLWLINDTYYTSVMIVSNLPIRIINSIILIFPYTIIVEMVRKAMLNLYIH